MTTKNKIIETVQNENPDKKVKMNISEIEVAN